MMLISTFIFVLLDSWPTLSTVWNKLFWDGGHSGFDRKVGSWERLAPKACRFGCCISFMWHMVTCSTSELNWYLKAFLPPLAVLPSIQLSSGASVFTARPVRLSYLEQMHWPTSYRAKSREKLPEMERLKKSEAWAFVFERLLVRILTSLYQTWAKFNMTIPHSNYIFTIIRKKIGHHFLKIISYYTLFLLYDPSICHRSSSVSPNHLLPAG